MRSCGQRMRSCVQRSRNSKERTHDRRRPSRKTSAKRIPNVRAVALDKASFAIARCPQRKNTVVRLNVPVKETACTECGGDLIGEDDEIVTNTEIPEAPSPEVKAYRVHSRTCVVVQIK